MKYLYNGCSRSELNVTPSNWKTSRASLKKEWRITYRFYDPAFESDPKYNKGKQVSVQGMNRYRTLAERQSATAALLKEIIHYLDDKGYNPITRQYMAPQQAIAHEIDPSTPFTVALEMGFKKLDCIQDTLDTIKSMMKYVGIAAAQLYDNSAGRTYNLLPVSQISTRHIKGILEQHKKNNPSFSNYGFNKYKIYLSMIFKELIEAEAIEHNPTRDIASKKKTTKLRAVLTPDEQKKIDGLKETNYEFWRYIRIFFRSGSRTTELLSLKKGDKVDLKSQEFTVMVKKGKSYREDIRAIPDDILPLWKEVWNSAKPGQYLFSAGLKPGTQKIRKEQVGRRWKRWVKRDMGINKDFYSLKHLHTDTVAAILDIEHAKVTTGHTSNKMAEVYAVGSKKRKLEKLKKTEVRFA